MHKIDNTGSSDERFYGVGHFDVIIVDEAHRSIYNRYKAIFEYFDATIIGLTATPKDGIDINTFELFGCANEDPTFLYELNEAVASNYLVPYKNIQVNTYFLTQGIKYKDLSAKEKEKNERMKNPNIPIDIRSYMIRQQGKLLDEEPNTAPAPAYIGDGDYHSDDE
jgi:type I restriction enzyme R subunit